MDGEAERIRLEVVDDRCYINPFKARMYMKYLLSLIGKLEKEKGAEKDEA
jgi:hypothetical protein